VSKALLVVSHNFQGESVDPELSKLFRPPVGDVMRTPKERLEFGPSYSVISASEIERIARDNDRDSRRKRRQTQRSRRLPEIEDFRTHRTAIGRIRLGEYFLKNWSCAKCKKAISQTRLIRDGETPQVYAINKSLCNECGLLYLAQSHLG
jgi:ribosomal protein L44E